jgi:ribosomal protein L20A (L18A)
VKSIFFGFWPGRTGRQGFGFRRTNPALKPSEAVNTIYKTQASKLDPALQGMQIRSLPKEKW